MKKTSLLAVVLCLLLAGPAALAQEEERDIIEVDFFGGLGVPAGGVNDWTTAGLDRAAKTGFDVGIDIGYFVTPKVVLGLNFVYTQFSFDNDLEDSNHSHRLYNPNLYVKYLFEGESFWVPYLKAHVGVENPKFSTFVTNTAANRYRELSYDPAFAYGFGAGLFYYTADYSGLYIETNYHAAFTEDSEAEYLDEKYTFNKNISTVDVHVGIRILFGT
jgi:hypothetical protein